MVESGCLLSSYGLIVIMGSNPILSAIFYNAPVAQLSGLEHLTTDQKAGGSNPLRRLFCIVKCDWFWMQEALSLARRAAQVGEVPVGAVAVKDGVATARAYNTRQQSKNPTAHAEILVIQRASIVTGDWRLTDTTLYVTLEPCPMCAGAILASRIPRVVYGAADPKAGAVDSLFGLLRDHRLNHQVEVRPGVLAEESSRLLKSFFGKRRQQISERCESG